MGEPQPGDIPDPTHVKTANILFETNQIGKSGEWAVYNPITDFWKMSQIILESELTTEAVQLQQDVNSTGFADGTVNAAAFGNGSWVYALIAGDVNPNSEVFLMVFDTGAGNAVGFANVLTFQGDVSVTTLVATVVTDIAHNFKIGDKTTVVSASLDETGTPVIITGISVDSLSFTFTTTSSDFGSETATASNSALNNGGVAKFIKRSGDTFTQKGVLNEIGVFSMTGARL